MFSKITGPIGTKLNHNQYQTTSNIITETKIEHMGKTEYCPWSFNPFYLVDNSDWVELDLRTICFIPKLSNNLLNDQQDKIYKKSQHYQNCHNIIECFYVSHMMTENYASTENIAITHIQNHLRSVLFIYEIHWKHSEFVVFITC